MKKMIFAILAIIPIALHGQTALSKITRNSHITQAYQISAKDAISYYKMDSIPVANFLTADPFISFKSEYIEPEKFLPGFYVLISARGSDLVCELFNKTNIRLITVNNSKKLQIDIRDFNGNSIKATQVILNNKPLQYHEQSKTYWHSGRIKDEASVIVMTPGDTLISTISAQDELRNTPKEQRRINFRNSALMKCFRKIGSVFKPRNVSNRIQATGYITFNKPKFKPGDTVRYKTYIFNKRKKPYSKPILAYLAYYSRGKSHEIFLEKLKPAAASAYFDDFVLGDSIPSDIRCTLLFKTENKKNIINSNFKTEEYVLDEMSTHSFSSNKLTYYRGDSIHFSTTVKDANGLNVLDARAKLILLSIKMDSTFNEQVIVPDTLHQEEQPVNSITDTRFSVDTRQFPAANMIIEAKMIIKNANNETKEKNCQIQYYHQFKSLVVSQKDDSIQVLMMENNRSITMKGMMSWNDEQDFEISYPLKFKINPMAEDYFFEASEDSFYVSTYHKVEKGYNILLSRISKADTVGFTLDNPYKIPVYYTVLKGNSIVSTGSSSEDKITWLQRMKNPKQALMVKWQFNWGGKEIKQQQNIGILYKVLNARVNYKEKIFPGQSDSISIQLEDYKGKPAADVNLTAVAYNNQFGAFANINEPPYLAKYRFKSEINRDGFDVDENDNIVLRLKYLLSYNKKWIKKLSLDTMEYYKLLFPGDKGHHVASYLSSAIIPQLSVYITKDGVPQEIFLLYINNQLAYYNAVTEKMKYSFPVYPNNVKLSIRLKNKLIEIDSLYLQPYYKHDISFDVNHLPSGAKVYEANEWWSTTEMSLIENSMLQMKGYTTNDNGWLWQGSKLIQFSKRQYHVVGPFVPYQEITFYEPNKFDLTIPFEPGYEYHFSTKISRLEKNPIFKNKIAKNFLVATKNFSFTLGDTLVNAANILYEQAKETASPLLIFSNHEKYLYSKNKNGFGKLSIRPTQKINIAYIALINTKDQKSITLPGRQTMINNIDTGVYQLLLINEDDQTMEVNNVRIVENGTTILKPTRYSFVQNHKFVKYLYQQSDSIKKELEKVNNSNIDSIDKPNSIANQPILKYVHSGTASIYGRIVDSKGGHPVPFVAVVIKGMGAGVQADVNGMFELRNEESKEVVLQFSQIGYHVKEINASFIKGLSFPLNVQLDQNDNNLQEVVVTSAFNTKRSTKSMAYSTTVINPQELTSIQYSLSGKIAGVQVTSGGNATATEIKQAYSKIKSNLAEDILYIVDGILYDGPINIEPNNIANITLLSGEEALAIYGARGVNGAIIIVTHNKTQRKIFRDYGYWIPQTFSNKQGIASFKVTYPDNVTSWKNFIVGIDKKGRIVKTSFISMAYKPMQSQLNLPLFLVEGDAAKFVGKALNYTTDAYSLQSVFKINNFESSKNQFILKPSSSEIQYLPVIANGDTLRTSFCIESNTGFKDEEERAIAVIKKGIEQSTGSFIPFLKDTSVQLTITDNEADVHIYAQNNKLDFLLQELENLKKYPYSCVEQICSKYRGYVLEKQIRSALNQPFHNQKEMNILFSKIQKSQNYDGGWPWWAGGNSNSYITNYIVQSLLPQRTDPIIETIVRNGLLFLSNKLPATSSKEELLSILYTLSCAGHETKYMQWLQKVNFDSLSQHEQWQWVKIMQTQKQEYSKELHYLLGSGTETMFGGIHWGKSNLRWHSNEIATTLLAMQVLKEEKNSKPYINRIIQYFLSNQNNNYFRNTFESAGILHAIVPELLNVKEDFNSASTLNITGDTSFSITRFPYATKIKSKDIKNLSVQKSGGGITYFTLYQKWVNHMPQFDSTQFIIETHFEQNGKHLAEIKMGEKIKMKLDLKVLRDAEFVMISMPIPAGCIFTEKDISAWQLHKEYYKDKMIAFAEYLPKGSYVFEATLEPRYAGKYSINPAKVELMYFPTFSGNNQLKTIEIK